MMNAFTIIVASVVPGVAGCAMLVAAYFAGFSVFGYKPIRPGVGKGALVNFLSWLLLAVAIAAGYPFGIATIPDPWGAMLAVVIFGTSLSLVTYLMVSRPDRKAAVLLPVLPTILFAMAILASSFHY